MGELLATLERGQLIERTADPRNARVLRTTLTTQGIRAHGQGGAVVARVEARLGSVLSADEQRLMRELLERCAAALGAGERPPTSR
jgi:DNA-binding MarR family transcriptional regulator